MVIQNSDAAGEEEAHSQRDDCSNMTLSPKSNQLPVTRRKQPTEIKHDDKITTKTDTSEEDDRVHDNAHRKGTSLWSRFFCVPGCHVCQYLKQRRFSLVQYLEYRKRSGALPVWTTAVPKFPRWLTRRRIAGTSLLVVILDLTVVVYFTFYCPVTHSQRHHHHRYRPSSRPTTDQEVDRLPIILGRSGTTLYASYRREYSAQDLDEMIDIYPFGNNIYSLLHGLWVFYENEDETVVQDKTCPERSHSLIPSIRQTATPSSNW
jgi:hypothetical protein